MKKFILLLTLTTIQLFSAQSNVTGAYAIGIFDSGGNGENIQHAKKTKNDYNGTCYSKIFVVGSYYNIKPVVNIGNSRGHYQSSKPIYNKIKIKIGEVLLYKHFNVKKGYMEVRFKNRLYDSKVFVK
jgi:hypothetical protein